MIKALDVLKKTLKGEEPTKLFSDEGEKVQLQVTGIKLPKDERQHILKM